MPIKIAAAVVLLAASAFAQPPQPAVGPGAYDVVSIKLEGPDPQANGFRYTPTGFEAYAVTLTDIVGEAYGLPDVRLVKNASVVKPAYHIVAKFSQPDIAVMNSLPPAQLTQVRQRLLQAILRDRFQATVHHAASPLPIYSLEVGKSGLKLQQVALEPANASQEKKVAFFAPGRIKGVFSMEQLARILSLSRKVDSDASDRRGCGLPHIRPPHPASGAPVARHTFERPRETARSWCGCPAAPAPPPVWPAPAGG